MARNVTMKKYKGLILVIVVCIAVFCGKAFCTEDYASIYVQRTPQKGGTINIGAGVHDIALNTEITLIATPKPGYQFVYWLGSVSDPISSNTTAYVDSPKFIIAVFEKAEHELITAVDYAAQRPGAGSGGLRRAAADYQRQGGSGGGGRRPSKFKFPTPPETEPDVLIPGDTKEDELLIPGQPIPEPATIILMGFASLFLTRRKNS